MRDFERVMQHVVSGRPARFVGLLAANNESLELNAGEMVSLIGPNGTAKTTVFNCLTGFYRPCAEPLREGPIGESEKRAVDIDCSSA